MTEGARFSEEEKKEKEGPKDEQSDSDEDEVSQDVAVPMGGEQQAPRDSVGGERTARQEPIDRQSQRGAFEIVHSLGALKYLAKTEKTFLDAIVSIVVGMCVASIANVSLAFADIESNNSTAATFQNITQQLTNVLAVSAGAGEGNLATAQMILTSAVALLDFAIPAGSTDHALSIFFILVLLFTALSSKVKRHNVVFFSQMFIVHAINTITVFMRLLRAQNDRAERNEDTSFLWLVVVNFILLILWCLFAFALFMGNYEPKKGKHCLPLCYSWYKGVKKPEQRVVTLIAALVSTAFTVFASNLLILLARDESSFLITFIGPSLVVLSRSYSLANLVSKMADTYKTQRYVLDFIECTYDDFTEGFQGTLKGQHFRSDLEIELMTEYAAYGTEKLRETMQKMLEKGSEHDIVKKLLRLYAIDTSVRQTSANVAASTAPPSVSTTSPDPART